MGPGQISLYTATGQYLPRLGRVVQRGGPAGSYNNTVFEDPNWPAAQPYSWQQRANMRAQILHGGDNGAWSRRLNAMSKAELMEELSRYG